MIDEPIDRPIDDVQVLIVGAGPAGLTAAITLARLGIECLVVERRSEPIPLPRATVQSLRTMELLRSWGLEAAVRAGGDDVEWRMLICPTLARASEGQVVAVGLPTPAQSALISPTTPGSAPQDHLERVLLDHLRSLSSAHVVVGAEVTDVRQGPSGIRATVRDLESGTSRELHTGHLVVADGAHSTIRKQLGITVTGGDRLHESMSVVMRAPIWDLVGPHRFGIYATNGPGAEGTFLPAGRHGRWIYGVEWDPTTERIDDYSDERLTQMVRRSAGHPGLEVIIERVGSFSFIGTIADRFRRGNVLLIGDAAHRVTPRGGTGMNTAIADGFDVGWKLAWVLRGWSPASLVDSYESERRPVAEHNLARSIDRDGSRREAIDEVAVDLGGRIRHLWCRASDGSRRSTLDLVGPGLTLFTTQDAVGVLSRSTRTGLSAPCVVRVLDPLTARGLGIGAGGGLIVRPDGVPVRGVAPDPTTRGPAPDGRTREPVLIE